MPKYYINYHSVKILNQIITNYNKVILISDEKVGNLYQSSISTFSLSFANQALQSGN
jgi:hypothetical protein